LPEPVRERLTTAIAQHQAPAGLATEKTTSPLYQSDGYWRGPVWAPSTVLIEDGGLRRAG
jgi:glycogen debranching enzyme